MQWGTLLATQLGAPPLMWAGFGAMDPAPGRWAVLTGVRGDLSGGPVYLTGRPQPCRAWNCQQLRPGVDSAGCGQSRSVAQSPGHTCPGGNSQPGRWSLSAHGSRPAWVFSRTLTGQVGAPLGESNDCPEALSETAGFIPKVAWAMTVAESGPGPCLLLLSLQLQPAQCRGSLATWPHGLRTGLPRPLLSAP